jgi:hypothetical protein
VAASDTDELLASQGGIARKVTRAQLLATAQPVLALAPATLLGRVSAGTGGPESITIGANLGVLDGALFATASPYSVGALPAGREPGAADLVALSQGGQDVAIPYPEFVAALAGVPGINAGQMVATPNTGTTARTLSDSLADAIPIEAFGAKGDGQTDDSAALAAALATGAPVRFGARTYVIAGQFTIAQPAVLIGHRAGTVLRRGQQRAAGAWISIQGASAVVHGVTFDANATIAGPDSWGVLVAATCTAARFSSCTFANSRGPTLGCGLAFAPSDPLATQHVVRDCEAYGNAVHGIWVQAVNGIDIMDCRCHDNAGYGVCVDCADPALVQKIRLARVTGTRAWNNIRGISVGNFNATNTNPPVWGNANPDAIGVLVADNTCHDNSQYGIAVSGLSIMVEGNLLSGNSNAGILANVSSSRICGNLVTGSGSYGIDAGGSIDSDISGNHVSGAQAGINPGGSQRVRVSRNLIENCVWGITLYNVETDGHGRNFGQGTQLVEIAGNWITIDGTDGGGIYLVDAPQGVLVTENAMFGMTGVAASQALWGHTDGVVVRGNAWNNLQRLICNPVPVGTVQQVEYPEILDGVMITAAPLGVQSILGQHQAAVGGQITFIKVTAGGSGYSQAPVAIQGAGSGATAIAYVANGAVIGVAVTSSGSGYGTYGAAVSVSITGDGTGATATASVGLPVWEERRLRIACNCAVALSRAGSLPFQDNWTLDDVTLPANTEVELVGSFGGWRAAQFPASNYVAPPGDGSLELHTVASGDLVLRPQGAGRVRVASDAETFGAVSCIGRGTPLGVVAAPPGSDYRNLSGGVGETLWIKQTGTDSSGWIAVA